ncbi:hypothetical protein LHYA1_G007829 [Lachnellula hyalina]|uniref:CipC protein n=1 Tax=Lachnellula hyalina TaxID=1316788 RepID=A0A8H8TWB3_9HELO|nr:uncharacterized protein LHYA1_G007829 [Lachnellula hyalina]TVY23125.1 hypothetical protein LHYA1_G007829 [Lachnellula hyalina]
MGWFDGETDERQAYDQFQQAPDEHKAKMSHELVGGAAAYYAAREYEKHCAQNGKPDSHAQAKELLAGFAGAFIDREFETKGLSFVDRERAKHDAHKRVHEQVRNDY